jgi:enamine deaminase RidA (YjgF/YER057c/UK114 family)
MKSALELAMERFGDDASESQSALTQAQKEALAEVDRKFQSRIAEREVFLSKQIAETPRQRDYKALEDLEKQLRNERLRLREECEEAKEKIRRGT